jgi:alkylated DNA repair dioxygenase AlkB
MRKQSAFSFSSVAPSGNRAVGRGEAAAVLIAMPDADVRYRPEFLPALRATVLFHALHDELDWRADRVQLFGRAYPIPRLHQWYGDAAATYRWSGLTMQPCPWPPSLCALRDSLQTALNCRFNSVLANLYRDGADCMGWHADDEQELGPEPVIASISLGAERDFVLRCRRKDAQVANVKLPLAHGSLLLMQGVTQQHWQHSLPRRKRVTEARINLTFRLIRKA